MCGIVGIYAVGADDMHPVERELLIRMRDAMIHRGPDGGGDWVSGDRRVGLGFRRLAIIDLSDRAMQPMCNEDGTLWLVFNGEIYNHAEIRAELERIGGHIWKTDHSDSEVILHAFEAWGIECLQRLRGMFAFALYHQPSHTLYLARDRFGQKPLFYTQCAGQICFASEAHALLSGGVQEAKVNEEAIYHYLTTLTVPAPHSFYQQINKVEPGTYLAISPHNIVKHQYWNIADYINQVAPDNFEDAVHETAARLEASMRYRNIADVPVAVALSGGLDSSLDLYYAKQYNPDITAVHVAYSQTSEYDESDAARRFCEDLQVPFVHTVIDENDFQALITDYLAVQSDIPVGDPNGALLYGISRIARDQGAKVLIVGEGGDEGGRGIHGRSYVTAESQLRGEEKLQIHVFGKRDDLVF